MKITQATVDRIIARAKASDFGLGEGLTHKNGHNQISQYGEHNLKALGMLLVNGYDAKYDLISVFIAGLETVAEAAAKELRVELDKARSDKLAFAQQASSALAELKKAQAALRGQNIHI